MGPLQLWTRVLVTAVPGNNVAGEPERPGERWISAPIEPIASFLVPGW